MDEIIPGLWIGDLLCISNVEALKANKITSILSAMRGKIVVHKMFRTCQILLDDDETTDALKHFIPAITFIQAELDYENGRGVLVHCQAGMSRSATIVAAYIMYTQRLDVVGAMEIIRKKRPGVRPSQSFLLQLEIFYHASFQVTKADKTTRMFYMERTIEEVMNGDGTMPPTDMFASFPSTPGAKILRAPKRRIVCKACRRELAAHEHMLDHGQLGPATPAVTSSSVTSPVNGQEKRRGSSGLGMIPMTSTSSSVDMSSVDMSSVNAGSTPGAVASTLDGYFACGPTHQNVPPILINPKCSGYFLEPIKWMTFSLLSGSLYGSIVCPSTDCVAKLGSYDWAGVKCGCGEWVTPGFCIERAMVEEVS